MNNATRREVYLRDRSVLTPAQRRRVRHHDNAAQSAITPSLRRAARRDVLLRDRRVRASIHAMFRRPVVSTGVTTPRKGKSVVAAPGGTH